jgi:hypothetical protein
VGRTSAAATLDLELTAMTNLDDIYRRWTDRFWERFFDTTGWDPSPDQQLTILAAVFAALAVSFLLLYVRRIMRKSNRATKRDKMVANYQHMRRYQNADDR